MLSFNHYAYGAVIDWVYRHVAGLAPDRGRPGYAHVNFAPRPARGIDHAAASVDSAFGTVSIAWRLDADRLIADIELPTGHDRHLHGAGVLRPPTLRWMERRLIR